MRFIQRDYTRTEHDDFVLNIQPKLSERTEAIPQYVGENLVGWKISLRYE